MAIVKPTCLPIIEMIAESLNVDKRDVGSVTIEIPSDGPVVIRVEIFASKKMLELDWNMFEGARVYIVEGKQYGL